MLFKVYGLQSQPLNKAKAHFMSELVVVTHCSREGFVDWLQAANDFTKTAVVLSEEVEELCEALLLLEHVHGQDQSMTTD